MANNSENEIKDKLNNIKNDTDKNNVTNNVVNIATVVNQTVKVG